MDTLLIIILLLVFFGGGGFWYGNRTWGPNGGFGIVGAIVVIFLVLYLLGALPVGHLGRLR